MAQLFRDYRDSTASHPNVPSIEDATRGADALNIFFAEAEKNGALKASDYSGLDRIPGSVSILDLATNNSPRFSR